VGADLDPLEEKLKSLERRLQREKTARENAESLLLLKADELYNSLLFSQQSQKKLELALWASQESFWDWQASHDIIDIRAFSLNS
jgi:hypothetical protein